MLAGAHLQLAVAAKGPGLDAGRQHTSEKLSITAKPRIQDRDLEALAALAGGVPGPRPDCFQRAGSGLGGGGTWSSSMEKKNGCEEVDEGAKESADAALPRCLEWGRAHGTVEDLRGHSAAKKLKNQRNCTAQRLG
jgi:hypothetical protein